MRHLPPRQWCDVQPETVIMDGATPRRVLINDPISTSHRFICCEGAPAAVLYALDWAQVVELTEADALGTLFAAGLSPHLIEGQP